MDKQLGFFGLLSAGIMGRESIASPSIDSLLIEEQSILVRLLNQYQDLFDKQELLEPESAPQESPVKAGTLAKQHAALFAYYQAEIEEEKNLQLDRQNFTERYYRLFKKYEQKLNRTNLSPRQRRIYKKLYYQYSQLYKESRPSI